MIDKIKSIVRQFPVLYKFRFLYWKMYCLFHDEGERVKRDYRILTGLELNLEHPESLNEKIIWLKLNYYEDFYTRCADKYLVRGYIKEITGKDICPELLYVTRNVNELSVDKIGKFPCIIKVSSGSGANLIVRDKNQYTDQYLRNYFKRAVISSQIQNLTGAAHQYLKQKPYIVVEELLQNPGGGIPNDYKFFYIGSELQFIYCSVDRLGINVRHVYDREWNRLHFIWVQGADKELFDKYERSDDIEKPQSFDEMVKISQMISRKFPLVRIDFYDVGGQPYLGEITLHHGSGYDAFYPCKYDLTYGRKVVLPERGKGYESCE